MTLTAGINHVALVTQDLDGFIAFYGEVFDARVLFDVNEDGQRHAAIDLGAGAALHAFASADNPHAVASTDMFNRGHLATLGR